MPLYDYFCKECLKRYEVVIKLEDWDKTKDEVPCHHCQGALERIPSAPYFVVKSAVL